MEKVFFYTLILNFTFSLSAAANIIALLKLVEANKNIVVKEGVDEPDDDFEVDKVLFFVYINSYLAYIEIFSW